MPLAFTQEDFLVLNPHPHPSDPATVSIVLYFQYFSGSVVGINATLIAQRSIDVAQLATHVGQFLSEMGYFNQAESMLQEAHKNLYEVKIVLTMNPSLKLRISNNSFDFLFLKIIVAGFLPLLGNKGEIGRHFSSQGKVRECWHVFGKISEF